ncbi:thymidine kinase [Klebsiella quasipneumoniae]|nr:thymidine kinase [Klebsiella quasipneumoniae]
MRTVVYTAEIDDRFGAGKVSSRIGLSSPARLYNPQTSLYNDIAAEHKLKPIHCVLVDESQFLTREQVHELSEVVDTLDIPVLCYGLRTDFRGELFTGSQYLLAWSDKLVELKTICFCGRKAREGANKQVISSQADSLIKISRIWADFFPANTSNQPI